MASVSMELVETMMELNIIYDSFFCMMVRMTKMISMSGFVLCETV
jgi:hypothetical protein